MQNYLPQDRANRKEHLVLQTVAEENKVQTPVKCGEWNEPPVTHHVRCLGRSNDMRGNSCPSGFDLRSCATSICTRYSTRYSTLKAYPKVQKSTYLRRAPGPKAVLKLSESPVSGVLPSCCPKHGFSSNTTYSATPRHQLFRLRLPFW